MAKDPAFLFYPGDWLGGTMGMTFEQKGAYFELLIFQFNNGRFTESQAKQVLSICSASVWEIVKSKFKFSRDLYYNERLDEEICKRQKYTESRRKNASSKTKKPSKAYAPHMEDENKDEDISTDIIIKDKKIPTLTEFLDHGRILCGKAGFIYKDMVFSMEQKYHEWVAQGWKDGYGKQIKIWKSKLGNTLPHLKSINQQHGQTDEQKYQRVHDTLERAKLSQSNDQ